MAKNDKRLTLVNMDDNSEIECQLNPGSISINKTVPWNEHKRAGDTQLLEFTNAQNRELSVELFFDTFETREHVDRSYLDALTALTMLPDPLPAEEDLRRPPKVMLVWGRFLRFEGFIASVATKYTMFLPDGTPVRATATVKMKEASKPKPKVKRRRRAAS